MHQSFILTCDDPLTPEALSAIIAMAEGWLPRAYVSTWVNHTTDTDG